MRWRGHRGPRTLPRGSGPRIQRKTSRRMRPRRSGLDSRAGERGPSRSTTRPSRSVARAARIRTPSGPIASSKVAGRIVVSPSRRRRATSPPRGRRTNTPSGPVREPSESSAVSRARTSATGVPAGSTTVPRISRATAGTSGSASVAARTAERSPAARERRLLDRGVLERRFVLDRFRDRARDPEPTRERGEDEDGEGEDAETHGPAIIAASDRTRRKRAGGLDAPPRIDGVEEGLTARGRSRRSGLAAVSSVTWTYDPRRRRDEGDRAGRQRIRDGLREDVRGIRRARRHDRARAVLDLDQRLAVGAVPEV